MERHDAHHKVQVEACMHDKHMLSTVVRCSPTELPMILAAALLEGPATCSAAHLSSTKMCLSCLGGNLFLNPNLASNSWNHCTHVATTTQGGVSKLKGITRLGNGHYLHDSCSFIISTWPFSFLNILPERGSHCSAPVLSLGARTTTFDWG